MNPAKKGLCRLLVVSVACLSIHSARAEMIATEQAVTHFGRAELASQLHSLGVEAAFAEQRVAAMSDEEIDTLIGKLGSLPAGGQMSGGGASSGGYGGGGGGGAFLAVLLLALLVAWLIYIATPRSPAKTLNSSF